MADEFQTASPDIPDRLEVFRENLPDFSVVVVKKEVLNYYDNEFESTTSSIQERKPFFQGEILPTYSNEAHRSEITDNELDKSVSEKQENDVILPNDTKYKTESIDEIFFERTVSSYDPKVELHDIQSYLQNSRRFCETCGILFPELNIFDRHMQLFHTETSSYSSDLAKLGIYKCNICDKKFVAAHVLRRHLSNIHKLINVKALMRRTHKYKSIPDKTKRHHKCTICGKKFVASHVLTRHLINIHKLKNAKVQQHQNCQSTTNTTKEINSPIVNHDDTSGWSNTCFHCKKSFDTQKSLIEHLYDILQMKRKNTETVPVLKSILFKCNKCDIHFTSSQFAANHAEHMEMLINWKCTICNRIFKNEDALSHERQHTVTNKFFVYNLEDLDVTKILYKCSKCSVHFTESNFLYHFRDCGLEVSKYVNCKICNLLLDYNLKTLHEHTEPNYHTIIECDVLSDNPVKLTEKKYPAKEKLKELHKSLCDVKVVLQRVDLGKYSTLNKLKTVKWSSSGQVSKTSNNVSPLKLTKIRQYQNIDFERRNLTYYFCETCKCFVTRHKKKIHLQARCKKIAKNVCKRCGLMFTTASLLTHNQLHKVKKDLSLNHFKFFNLYNGKPINPVSTKIVNIKRLENIHKRRNLTYLYCETCKCFLTKFCNSRVHKRKRCKQFVKITCKHCRLPFTSASMVTHRRLHEERKDLSLKDFKLFNLYNGQPMSPVVPELKKNVNESENSKAEFESENPFQYINDKHTRRNLIYYYCETCRCCLTKRKNIHLEARCRLLPTSSCNYCDLKFTNLSIMKHVRLHEEGDLSLNNIKLLNLLSGQPINPPALEVINFRLPVNNEAEDKNIKQPQIIDDSQRSNLAYYFCESCKCCVGRRKHVHLEARCEKLPKSRCDLCGLIFTKGTMTTHMRLHEEGDLSLSNIELLDLHSGKPIIPPASKVINTIQPVNKDDEDENLKKLKNINDHHKRRNFTYYFCETCKCYVTKFRKITHLEGRCQNIAKGACKHCGLMFTKASLMTHRQLHNENKTLSLNNFKFFNLYNGQPINPAKRIERTFNTKKNLGRRNLTYHYCETCKCFLTKFHQAKIHKGKFCKKIAKMSCKYCGLTFTSSSLLTHLRLHEERKDLTIKNFKFFNLYNGQPMKPVPELTNINKCAKIEATMKHIKRSDNIEDWYIRRKFTYYYCGTCKCFITVFKKVTHLEGRCKHLTKMTCKRCGLMFTSSAIMTHLLLHKENIDLSLKDFQFFDLCNGQPMNFSSVHEIVNKKPSFKIKDENLKKQPVNMEAKFPCVLGSIDGINYTRPGNTKSEQLNEKNPVIIEDETVNVKPSVNIDAEIVNNEAHAKNVVHPKNIEKDVEGILEPVKDEISVSNFKNRLRVSAGIENLKCFINDKSPVNIEAEDENVIRDANNECQGENFIQPMNMETEIEEIVCPVNDDAWVSCINGVRIEEDIHNVKAFENRTTPANIDAEFEIIIQVVNNEEKVQNVIQPINVETGCERTLDSLDSNINNCVSIAEEIEDVNRLVNKEAEIVNLKGKINIEDSVTCNIEVLNQNTPVENLETFVHSTEVLNQNTPVENLETFIHGEGPNVKLILNSKYLLLNNKGEKERINEAEVVNVIQPVDSEGNTLKVIHPDNSSKFNLIYNYCETCKCYITQFRKKIHLKARCKKLARMTCQYCGLMFTSGSMITHTRLHESNEGLTLKNFKFFNLYNGQPMNTPITDVNPECKVVNVIQRRSNKETVNVKETINVEAQMVKINQRTRRKARVINRKQNLSFTDKLPRRTGTYYFCDTCKCFITNFKTSVHLQGRCKEFSKTSCTRCGLKLTRASMMTHKLLHKHNRNFSLDSFKFFNLYNGEPMNTPTYDIVNWNRIEEERNLRKYYCETCKCFVTEHEKAVHLQANCMNLSKIACKCCGLILTSASFTLHKSLHEERKDLTLNDFKFLDLYNSQHIHPPVPEYPKCSHCAVHFLTITAKNSHICSDVSSLTCQVCDIKLSEAAFKLHMTFHQYTIDNTNTKESNKLQSVINLDKNVTEKIVTNTTNTHESNEIDFRDSHDVDESPLQKSSDAYGIVYTCQNCSVSVDTYDKAVEHSQRHYEVEEHVTETIACNFCNLKVDASCYLDHQNLHERESQFEFLNFDSYFLPAENNLWIHHIFKTLPNDKVMDILRNSVYKFECRIKMDIVQNGDPTLTVYKCDQCGCFIEPRSLFKHSENACFKLRNHPCTECGIAFNSSAARIRHETIHKRPGLTAESYRIVVFNREKDTQINRSFCLRKKYVLYKCRSCDVIIDKLEEGIHECELTNVKNCPDCGLLLNMKDYESHMNTHKTFISFNYNNIKLILLGKSNPLEMRKEKSLVSKFKGAIYDYKMFVCNKCEICIRNKDFMLKHICRFGKQRLKCLTCELYFSVGRLKTHMRCHEQDPDFLRSNMYIIAFDPCTFDQNKNATKMLSKDKDCELSEGDTDSDSEFSTDNNVTTNIDIEENFEEETAKIYKCTCGLHFLNEDSIFRHFGTCRSNTKIINLKCQICDLLFTPNVLFTHLLAHHNKSGRGYRYDIIEMDNNQVGNTFK